MGDRFDPGGDKAREEFFSEAQEIVDGLSRDLLALDESARRGETDAELVNDVFRAVHTLKGLSGLFGAAIMSGLSHELENLLDDLRLGRIELNAVVLDLLFRGVELYARILAAAKGEAPEPADEVKELLAAVAQVGQQKGGPGGSVVAQYELDPGLLGVLTEYEEHRLRTNIQAGLFLYRLRVLFQLATIDSALDDLKAKARPFGEIITFLPTGEGGDVDSVELEILLASRASLAEIRQGVVAPNLTVEEVRRRGAPSTPVGSSAQPALTHIPKFDAEMPTSLTSIEAHALLHEEPNGTRTSIPPPPGESLFPPSAGFAPEASPDRLAQGPREMTLRSVSQTVRVDIRRLDHLMNIVGELAIVRSAVARLAESARFSAETRGLASDLQRLHRTFDRHLTQMQDGILGVRMVPLGQVFDKLARIVRQISREHDKLANLVIAGAETEIDKLIVEELSDPLMHMIRNAIDHGIEDRDTRMQVGKPAVGTIALNAFQKGNHVVIEVEDDGRGMDPAVILAAAIRRGLIGEAEAREVGAREILRLIFQPGFTTRTEATELSGRGVGMDVVRTNIAKLGGVVDISSELGIGTKMTITLPITLAIIRVLIIEVAGRTYCMPLSTVEEAIVFDEASVRTFEGREVMTQRGATLPIARLARLFNLQGHRAGLWSEGARIEIAAGSEDDVPELGGAPRRYVVVSSIGEKRVGFVVDKLVGQQDIVIKALGASLSKVHGFAGATELGDQRVALVLDAGSLIDEVLASVELGRLPASAGVSFGGEVP